jgi:hypothetical protein
MMGSRRFQQKHVSPRALLKSALLAVHAMLLKSVYHSPLILMLCNSQKQQTLFRVSPVCSSLPQEGRTHSTPRAQNELHSKSALAGAASARRPHRSPSAFVCTRSTTSGSHSWSASGARRRSTTRTSTPQYSCSSPPNLSLTLLPNTVFCNLSSA